MISRSLAHHSIPQSATDLVRPCFWSSAHLLLSSPPLIGIRTTGARFGPRAIRASSARQLPHRGFNTRAGLNPYTSFARILDCGDIPITPFDNALALRQMTEAFTSLLSRRPLTTSSSFPHPKLVTLSGDHSVALPTLRALQAVYHQPIAVLHFDAHLDTW